MTFNAILCTCVVVVMLVQMLDSKLLLYETVVLSNGRDLARLVSDLRDDELIAVDGSLSKKVVALEP